MEQKSKRSVKTESNEILMKLLGSFDENLETIAKEFGVSYDVGEKEVIFFGAEAAVTAAAEVTEALITLIENGERADKSRVLYLAGLKQEGSAANTAVDAAKSVVAVTARGKQIHCKTVGQRKYVDAIRRNSVTFGIGPAGTGKTYLAVALAVAAFKNKEVDRIVLTRPAVEAGEKLGFLPGDLQTKVDPYLRPLYDALSEMFGQETYQKLMERGSIEVAPLAYMRGRTLNNAFIILDEAQNTTREQMKMFLTRMGEGSRVVVNGDLTQIDLPRGVESGLKHAAAVLENVEGVAIIPLSAKDVVRHELVMRIIRAYEKADEEGKAHSSVRESVAREKVGDSKGNTDGFEKDSVGFAKEKDPGGIAKGKDPDGRVLS